MSVISQIKSKVNKEHYTKLCRAFWAPPGDLAAIMSQAPPPLSRPPPFLLVQPQMSSCKIFCCIQMRILEINCATVHLHCYFTHVRPIQTSVLCDGQLGRGTDGTVWTAATHAAEKNVVHFSTPTGNCQEFHHLCLEMPTTIISTCTSSAYFETC